MTKSYSPTVDPEQVQQINRVEAKSSVTITQKLKGARTKQGDVDFQVVVKQYYDGDILEAGRIIDTWDKRRDKVYGAEDKTLKSNAPTDFNTKVI